MIQKNVLVTSAGVATGVNVISALRSSTKYRSYITSTDMSEDSAGLHLSDNYYITPCVNSTNFFDNLIEIIEKKDIDFIFPLHSSEIEFFADNKKQLNELGVGVTIPEKDVINLCNNKDLFELFLRENGFIYPKTFKDKNDIDNYPVFIKEKIGSSSKNAYKVNSEEVLEFYINGKEDKYIIQEYVDWQEITIDCYVNENYQLVGFVPRFRLKVKDGKSVVAKTMYNQHVFDQTKTLLQKLNYKGACNIQMFYKNGETKIIEINPRLAAGGLPLSIKAGVNIPELMMLDYFDIVDDDLLEYNKNLTMYRYLTEVFV